MSLVLQSSGGGQITVQEPTTASNFTQTLPASTGTVVLTDVAGTVALAATGSNIITASTNSVERMRIDSSGNVGIGTNSPATYGQVVAFGNGFAAACSAGTTSAKFEIFSNGQTNNQISLSQGFGGLDNIGYLYNRANAAFVFGTNNTERMRITSGGDLLVGINTGSYGSLSGRITCNASSGGSGLFYTSYSGDVSTSALNVGKFDNNSTTSQVFVRFAVNNAGLGCGQINGNGAGAAAFGSFSDNRLKENIEDLPPQLANITALRPVEFDYIESEGGGHQIGFIAQELQEVYPDAVGERYDGMLTVTGWNKTEARLVKAIQEQQELIKQLQATVDLLSTEVAALKGTV
jgi:hypothetical protein